MESQTERVLTKAERDMVEHIQSSLEAFLRKTDDPIDRAAARLQLKINAEFLLWLKNDPAKPDEVGQALVRAMAHLMVDAARSLNCANPEPVLRLILRDVGQWAAHYFAAVERGDVPSYMPSEDETCIVALHSQGGQA